MAVNVVYDFSGFGGVDESNPTITACIYDVASQLAHSCTPNCSIDRVAADGDRCNCCVIAPVQKGDELVHNYAAVQQLLPAHSRKAFYNMRYDFKCSCPRCTALGDETRQFNCFD